MAILGFFSITAVCIYIIFCFSCIRWLLDNSSDYISSYHTFILSSLDQEISPIQSQGEYLYMNQIFLKYKRMGVKPDVDYRTFISRFKNDHNPDTKDYKYDAEDRKDENWRSYNRVVSVLESHSNLVAKLFNAESSKELTMQVFHQLIAGEQKKDIEERTLDSAENISPNEMSNYPCDGIVSPSNPLGVCYKDLSFFITEITSTVNNIVAQVGNERKVWSGEVQ